MINYIIYRIGEFIALNLPLKLGYKLAVLISDLNYIISFSDRKAVKDNLKVIFPDKSNREIYVIRRKMFRNFAKYLVDFFRFSKLDIESIKKNIRIENLHYFDEEIKKGSGIIILTAHLGNWELGGIIIALLGYPLWVVALPHKNKRVDEFFNYQRESKGIQVIPFGKAARQCLNLLKENKLLALVGDRDFSEKGITIDFFGKKTLFPLGPAAFSLKTNTCIIPGFMVRNPDDTFTLRIEKPIYPEKSGGPDKNEVEVLKIINNYKLIFEDYIRKYPDQWYMFKKFPIS